VTRLKETVMGIVMGVTASVLGFAAALVGLVLWTALLFPRPAAAARAGLESRPGRCFLTGLFLVVLLGVPMLALLRSPNGLAKLAGWIAALPLLTILVLGFAGMAQLLGERLRPLAPALTPLGALVRGAVLLELAALLPFAGWFLFAPVVGITLVGAGALGAAARARDRRRLIPSDPDRSVRHDPDAVNRAAGDDEWRLSPGIATERGTG
jgi:hypothetical protein